MQITRIPFLGLIALSLLSFGCTTASDSESPKNATFCDDITQNVQRVEQLHVERDTSAASPKSTAYTPCNYETVYGMWFPYLDYADTLAGKTADEFRKIMRQRFKQAADMGINTIFLHLRAFGDAYYSSTLFPQADTVGDFDPLPIILEEAHALKLSVHGWINPLRVQKDADMAALSDNFLVKKWYNESQTNGTYLQCIDNIWWLNPAYPEVRKLIADGVTEILEQYDVDGIHLDDYFYPTTDTSFDAAAFAASDSDSLSAFRLEQTNALVQTLFQTVHEKNPALLLSISPQGTQDGNYAKQYADVRRWGTENGYCDVLIPQVYFGFENETAPFAETVSEWTALVTNESVSLVIGIGTHKYGKEDAWAGTGSTEWITDLNLPVKQVSHILDTAGADGFAIYDYATTFQPESQAEAMAEQVTQIAALLRGRKSALR